MEADQRPVDRVIARVGDLPAMPAHVAEVMEVTDDPAVEMSEISDRIERDPALAAKILQVSNSPYYGLKQYVGTLKLALVVLGVREVRNIVLGISVFQMIRNPNIDALLSRSFWQHSVLVGAFAKKLGTRLAVGLQGEDFIGGLLHDIGKMVLVRQLGSPYEKLFRTSGGSSEPLCAMEMDALGFDHADAAAALGVRWNLPGALVDALCYHHAREDRSLGSADQPALAALVRIANLAVHDDLSDETGQTCRSCTEEEAWALLGSPRAPTEVSSRCETLKGISEELEGLAEPLF